MPIYEYRCTECGHELEALQKLSDSPLTTCPQCSNETLVKRVSAAAFRLKGGGWYETDFKSKNQKNLAGDKAKKPMINRVRIPKSKTLQRNLRKLRKARLTGTTDRTSRNAQRILRGDYRFEY